MAVSMRPLTLGEILDRTVQLYRRNFQLFLGIAVLPAAVDVLISGGAAIFFATKFPALANPTPGKPPNLEAILPAILGAGIFLLVGIPLLLGIFSIALAALTHAALALNRGETITLRDAYRLAFKHFWRYVGILSLQFLFAAIIPGVVLAGVFILIAITAATIVPKAQGNASAIALGLVTFGLILMLMAGCVWIWIRFCLSFSASIAESKRVWPSMQRSGQLSKGTRGRIFVMYLMVGILTIVVYYALLIPIDLALGMRIDKLFAVTHTAGYQPILIQSVNLFLSFLERAFVMPIYAIALVLFYADQRTRLEGYDIEQLMAQAGWAAPSLNVPPPLPQAIHITIEPESTPAPVGEPGAEA